MNNGKRRKLVECLRYAPFMKDEMMTRQGAPAHWLYILTKASAEVIVSTETGVHRTVNILHAGDSFGEMSLLTGEPRVASLRALEDTDCYRLDRDAFEDILHGRPEMPSTFPHCWRAGKWKSKRFATIWMPPPAPP